MTHVSIVDTPEMSPAVALAHWLTGSLAHWREKRMTIEAVLSRTGYQRFSELYQAYEEMLINENQAAVQMRMSPDEIELEDLVARVWSIFGDYLREFIPPWEYDEAIDALKPIILGTRQDQLAAVTARFTRRQ